MVLGGKTPLWCENGGIVFLRPPQAHRRRSRLTPEGAAAALSLLSRLLSWTTPSALSGRDHLFTGRCDLVIPPLSRDLLPYPVQTGERGKYREEGE